MGERGTGRRSPGPRSPFSLVFVVGGLLAAVFGARALISAATSSPAPERTLAVGSSLGAAQPSPTQDSGSPPSSPSPRASKAPPRGSLVIHGAGDVSLDPSYISTYRTNGYGYAWSGLGGLFQRDDLTVVNVECPVSNLGTKVPGKEFSFRGDPAALPAMQVTDWSPAVNAERETPNSAGTSHSVKSFTFRLNAMACAAQAGSSWSS